MGRRSYSIITNVIYWQRGDPLDGCAGLEDVSSFSEWTRFDSRSMEKYGIAYVPSVTYLAAREKDDRLVGIMGFRRRLNPYLLNYGGNIGYSVRPSERGKGYAAGFAQMPRGGGIARADYL